MDAQWSRIDQQVVSVIEGNGIGTGGIATDTFGAPQGLVEQIALEKQLVQTIAASDTVWMSNTQPLLCLKPDNLRIIWWK